MPKFVWYDLMTSDMAAATAFYTNVVGWSAVDSGLPGPPYTILSMGETMIGGLTSLTPEDAAQGSRAFWTGYVGVDDVDAYVVKVTDAGGSICKSPADIPGIGRFAVVADPQGAAFILFTPNNPGEPTEAGAQPGRIAWHELHCDDVGVFDFYERVFGWTRADSLDMGPAGMYLMFSTGGNPCGGVMKRAAESPHPFWLYYFAVPGIDAAMDRTKAGGGTVFMGPQQIPGGGWIALCLDPQGGVFALLSYAR
jgi:predicted enzyme related to lactoylglutathione lyase